MGAGQRAAVQGGAGQVDQRVGVALAGGALVAGVLVGAAQRGQRDGEELAVVGVEQPGQLSHPAEGLPQAEPALAVLPVSFGVGGQWLQGLAAFA